MSTFFLIRHALMDHVGRALAGRAPGVHLNATGRRQSEQLALRLAREPIRQVYTSPLERARETAEAVASRLQVEARVAEPLTEIDFGSWTGRTLEQLAPSPEWQRFNSFRTGTRAPGGELILETQARVVTFMEKLRTDFPDQGIALVSHGDVLRAAVAHYLGIPLDFMLRFEISPASVSAIKVEDSGPVCLYLNRTESEA